VSYARIHAVVRRIPEGRVASYGQIARLADLPGHARQVGYALAALRGESDVPWQRVINARGEVSLRKAPGYEHLQRALLEREGVVFDAKGRVSLARFGWQPEAPTRPGRAALDAARDRRIPDVIAKGLRVLFCGINPSLYSAATGQHFARPGNRFWPTLHRAGFTPRQLAPAEQRLLLDHGVGITNLVARATATAAELSREELATGRRRLVAKLRRQQPRLVAVLGIDAYRQAFARPHAALGRQPEPVAGRPLWVLPNPSGLNAHYQLDDLARLYAGLRRAAETERSRTYSTPSTGASRSSRKKAESATRPLRPLLE
jgi:TDG/mug DNA glycosylase family protein